jgi:hypothetical protein
MRQTLVFLSVLMISFVALGAGSDKPIEQEWWCKTTPWTLNRDLGIGAIIGTLEQTDRLEILQMIWYEVVNHPPKTMAPPLIAYLSKTEPVNEVREFIKAHTFFAFERFTTDPLIRKWPQRPDYSEQKFELRQLCEHFRRIGGEKMLEGRGPQSTTSSATKVEPDSSKELRKPKEMIGGGHL